MNAFGSQNIFIYRQLALSTSKKTRPVLHTLNT